MKKALLILLVIFCGCQEDAPSHKSLGTEHPFVNMKLINVEGDPEDQWEMWEYSFDPGIRILCHHSGFVGSNGGRSTSCVIVGAGR